MNLRPRCREWLPLSTQQLRLRNLVRIKGVNIETNFDNFGKEILVYYSLHSSKDSEPLYTSEALPQRHLQQKWADIECNDILKSNANCVCVKVWMRCNESCDNQKTEVAKVKQNSIEAKEPINALARQVANTCLSPYKLPRPPDKLLFSWAVYFSGLVILSHHENIKCKPNCLIFYLNDAQFASPNHLTNETLCEQLSLSYQLSSSSLPKTSLENVNNFFINSPPVSRSSSPSRFNKEENLLEMSKTRYSQLAAFTWDVKISYSLKCLLTLQNTQRLSLQSKKESQSFIEEIKFLSLHCITLDELKRKPRTSSTNYHHSHHSMGRTLSNLLAEQQQVDPKALHKGRELMKEIESLRYRKQILEREYRTMSEKIQQKRNTLTALTNDRQLREGWLLRHFQQLNEENSNMPAYYQDYEEIKERKEQLVASLERSRIALCMELSEIYPIGHNGNSHTICSIPLPLGLVDPRLNSDNAENIPATALNAAFGYLAHLVQMIAVIMNRPLRNPIIYDGSRTRIRDVARTFRYPIREYPLYTRSMIPSQSVREGLRLLNQNIGQIFYELTGRHSIHRRSTVEFILGIFVILADIHKSQNNVDHSTTLPLSKYHLSTDDNKKTHQNGNFRNLGRELINASHSSVDTNHESPTPPPHVHLANMTQFLDMLPSSSSPLPILNSNNVTHQRISRSVGSYSDLEEEASNFLDQYYSNSESNLTFPTDD